jgi:hypothetical protein
VSSIPPLLKIQKNVLVYLSRTVHSDRFPDLVLSEEHAPITDAEAMSLTVQYIRLDTRSIAIETSFQAKLVEWASTSGSSSILSPPPSRSISAWSDLHSSLIGRSTSSCSLPPHSVIESDLNVVRVVNLRSISPRCLLLLVQLLADDPQIQQISVDARPILLNYNAQGISQSGSAGFTPFTDAGLLGEGQVVGIADSGLDDYSCYFWDNNGVYSTASTTRSNYINPVLETSRRKVIMYVAYADGYDGAAGHGTHVVGTVVGNSIFDDYSPANGLAPRAKVAFYDIMDTTGQYLAIPDTFTYLYPTLYHAGARVMSNSWGSPTESTTYDLLASVLKESNS